MHRFLQRLWATFQERLDSWKTAEPISGDASAISDSGRKLRRDAHYTLQQVSDVYEKTFSFNTAIARIMELSTSLRTEDAAEAGVQREAAEILLLCIAPLAPHLAEELWAALESGKGAGSIFREDWPSFDESAIAAEEKEFAVQINGKTRRTFMALPEADKEELIKKAVEVAVTYTEGKDILKHIVVPGRLVNIIVKDK